MNKINPEHQRHLDILSGLPGLGTYEQQVEIGDRMARRELVQVNEVWYERVDLSDEAAAAVRRAVQAKDEARPHDDDQVPTSCDCEYPPDPGGLHRPNCPAHVAPTHPAVQAAADFRKAFDASQEADRG